MNQPGMVYFWENRQIETLSKDELIAALKYSMDEIDSLRNQCSRLFKAVDPAVYLRQVGK